MKPDYGFMRLKKGTSIHKSEPESSLKKNLKLFRNMIK